MPSVSDAVTQGGKPFQVRGAATKNARSLSNDAMTVLREQTLTQSASIFLRRCPPHDTARSPGTVVPCRQRKMSTASLNSIRSRTGNQWRSRSSGVMCSYCILPAFDLSNFNCRGSVIPPYLPPSIPLFLSFSLPSLSWTLTFPFPFPSPSNRRRCIGDVSSHSGSGAKPQPPNVFLSIYDRSLWYFKRPDYSNKKLSYRRQIARRICANAMAWLTP